MSAPPAAAADKPVKADKKAKKNRTKLEFVGVQNGDYGTHPKDFVGAVVLHNPVESDKSGVKKHIIDETNFEKQVLIYVASGTSHGSYWTFNFMNQFFNILLDLLLRFIRRKAMWWLQGCGGTRLPRQ